MEKFRKNCYIAAENKKAAAWLLSHGYKLQKGEKIRVLASDDYDCGRGAYEVLDVYFVNYKGWSKNFHKLLKDNDLLLPTSIKGRDLVEDSYIYI